VREGKKTRKYRKLIKYKKKIVDPFSSLNGTGVPLCVCLHDILSYVQSVSNYQGTTMQYRTKMPSPFSRAVVNLFFDVRRVYTLKHRFMVIPGIKVYVMVGLGVMYTYTATAYICMYISAITVQLKMPYAMKGNVYAALTLYSFPFI